MEAVRNYFNVPGIGNAIEYEGEESDSQPTVREDLDEQPNIANV